MKYFIFILFYVSCYFLYEPSKYAFGKYLTFSFLFIFPLFFFLFFKKSDFFVKFIISFLLFLYYYFFIYKFVLVVDGPIRFLGLIFSYIVIIFIHIPLLIYVLYCFSKVCGRVLGGMLGVCIIICIFYPAYSFKKQFDHLCNTTKNEAFDKIKKEDYVNLYGLNDSELKKYVKEKLGIEFAGYSITGIKLKNNSGYTSYPKIEILKDGRLRIAETSIFKNYKFFKGIWAHGENNLICKEANNFLTDTLRSKIEYTQKNYTCSLIVPFIRYRLSCRWGE